MGRLRIPLWTILAVTVAVQAAVVAIGWRALS
jgi:hypothetical protein